MSQKTRTNTTVSGITNAVEITIRLWLKIYEKIFLVYVTTKIFYLFSKNFQLLCRLIKTLILITKLPVKKVVSLIVMMVFYTTFRQNHAVLLKRPRLLLKKRRARAIQLRIFLQRRMILVLNRQQSTKLMTQIVSQRIKNQSVFQD